MTEGLELEPTTVPEWEAEDLLTADLAEGASIATPEQAKIMFEKVILTLPTTVLSQELVGYAASRQTPLGESIEVDRGMFDFHLMELPLNVLLPEHRKLVRLRVSLEATPIGGRAAATAPAPVVAYDLFPADTWDDRVHELGEASVDISKALTFVCPAPVGEVLGLKLTLPLRWRSRYVRVRTSDRLSNPLEWDVKDEDITQGFTGYAIWRVPKGAGLKVDAQLCGELRSARLFGSLTKAQFRTAERSYVFGG